VVIQVLSRSACTLAVPVSSLLKGGGVTLIVFVLTVSLNINKQTNHICKNAFACVNADSSVFVNFYSGVNDWE